MRIGVMGSRKTSTLDEMATCDEVKRARVKYVKFRLWNYPWISGQHRSAHDLLRHIWTE